MFTALEGSQFYSYYFVSENGLTIEPYVLRGESQKESGIAVNCKRNTSDSTYEPNQRVIMSHVTVDGTTTKIASNGKLVDQALGDKYEIVNGTVEDVSQYILKIKSKFQDMTLTKALCFMSGAVSHDIICIYPCTFYVYYLINEPSRGKPNNVVSEQVGHKPSCTSTEASKKLEISDLGRRGSVLSV